MATKNEKVMLTVGFKTQKEDLQEISNLLSKSLDKGLSGEKSKKYLNDFKESMTDITKMMATGYKNLAKPFGSKNEVKQIADSIDDAYGNALKKVHTIGGYIQKTFRSKTNIESIQELDKLHKKLQLMEADYKKISTLTAKKNKLGNANKLESQLRGLKKELNSLSKTDRKLTKDEIAKQKDLTKQMEEVNTKLEEKVRLKEEINKIQSKYGVSSQSGLTEQIDALEVQGAKLSGEIMSQQDYERLSTILKNIEDILNKTSGKKMSISDIAGENIDKILHDQELALKRSKTLTSVMREMGIPLLTLSEMVSTLKQVIRYSFDYIKNLDRALTEISVVSGKSREEVMKLTDTFIELSAKTGMAVDDIAQASTIFYQQGLDDEAVEKMTEYTALFAKISGETVPKAADQLTAAINGFSYSSEQVGEVVDKMSVLAAYSAADIDELATAMTKGASAASQAGLSFDEYNAYLATMIETTREAPENIGTSLKTIMARFQQVKKSGTTDDGETDVNKVETALKSVGVQLRGADNQLRDLGEVLKDLGPKWKELDRNTQAYLGTVIAGTRQQSRFISLMQHWDRAMELVIASENSAGAAAQMHNAAMEGLEATINNLTNAWQRLISNLLNGDSFKGMIKILTGFVKWLGKGNSLLKLLSSIMLLINAKTLITNMSLLKQGQHVKHLGTTWENLKDILLGVKETYRSINKGVSDNTLLLDENTKAVERNNAARGGKKPGKNDKKPKTNKKAPKAKGGFYSNIKTKLSTLGTKGAIAGAINGNLDKIQTLVGKGQLLIGTALAAYSAIDYILDLLVTTGHEALEKAEEKYNKVEEEMAEQVNIVKTVEENVDSYERLNRTLNKSTEQINEMTESAKALGEALPDTIIGYDENGNPIIDTSAARKAAKDADQKIVELSKEQIGNLGDIITGGVRASVEDELTSSGWGKFLSGVRTAGMTAAGVGIATASTGVGLAPGVVAAIVGGLGAALASIGIEEITKNVREFNELQEKTNKVLKEKLPLVQKHISIITSKKVREGTVDGVSQEQRLETAGFIGRTWIQNEWTKTQKELAEKHVRGKSYEKKIKKAFDSLGEEWEKALNSFTDKDLAVAYKEIEDIRTTIYDKSYNDIETRLEDLLRRLKIPKDGELYDSLLEAFMKSAYKGTKMGIVALVKELENRKEADLELLKKTTGEGSGEYEYVKANYDTAIAKTRNMNAKELDFYSMLGITSDVELYNYFIDTFGDSLKNALVHSTDEAIIISISHLQEYADGIEAQLVDLGTKAGQTVNDYTDIDPNKLDATSRANYDVLMAKLDAVNNSITTSWNALKESMDTPWKELYEAYEKIIDRTQTVRETLNSLMSGEGVDYEQWKGFTTLLDQMPLEDLSSEQILQYADAIELVSQNLYVENGMLYANAEAVETIGDLEEQVANIQIEAHKTELRTKKSELELEKQMVDAQIAYLEALYAESTGAENAAQLKTDAEKQWADATDGMRVWYVQREGEAAKETVENWGRAFGEILDKKNKLMTALASNKMSKSDIKRMKKELASITEELESDLTLDKYNQKNGEKDPEYQERLKLTISGLKKRSSSLEAMIQNINLKLAVLNSGIRKTQEGISSSSKELDKYISKLSKFLELLEHIEREEANLAIATKLKGMQTNTAVLNRMGDQLKYVIHLIGDMEQMLKNEEEEANDAAENIRKGYGDIVSFNPWGNYSVNMAKYNTLSDEHKKQLDEALKAYKDLIGERDNYYNKLLDYKKQELEINQEYVDKYIEAENKLVEAIKSREQKILDNKLAAIDKEIAAINKAAEARRKAREEEEESKELSGLQTDLQRALMDSSGASAVDILDIQQQIKDKQQEIADNSFDTMVDDMNQALENDKELEQKLFDERLEEMNWYWDEVDRIMGEGTQSIMETMKLYMDEFNKSSVVQQAELLKGWENTFTQAVKIGKVGAQQYQEIVKNLQESINGLVVDEDILTNGTINTAFDKRPVIEKPKENTNSGGHGGHGGGSYNKGSDTSDKVVIDPTTTPKKTNITITFDNGYDRCIYKSGVVGTSITMPSLQRKGYTLVGWRKGGSLYKPGSRYRLVQDETFYAEWKEGETQFFNPFDRPMIPGYQKFPRYANGGLSYHAGPAWLDGTASKPEAVLNSIETKAFLQFTDNLVKLRQGEGNSLSNNIMIDNISFKVDSMSSPEDGEKAFNVFVDKFKEIGSKQGISILGTSNRN